MSEALLTIVMPAKAGIQFFFPELVLPKRLHGKRQSVWSSPGTFALQTSGFGDDLDSGFRLSAWLETVSLPNGRNDGKIN